MFENAIQYQGDNDLVHWETSKIRDLTGMFHHAIRFRGNISSWNTVSALEMDDMFMDTQVFDGDLR